MRLVLAALMVVGAMSTACAPRNSQEIEAMPAWRTPEGRRGVWREMANWYLDNDQPAQALDMVAKLRQDGVENPELDVVHANALMTAGIDDEARHILEGVIERYDDYPKPYQLLGIIYADAGEIDRAVETLERALELEPDDTPTRNNLGFLLLAKNRCGEARSHLEQVIAEEARNPRYRNNLAFALVCTGEPKRALKLFRSTGAEADARYNLGLAYERQGSLPSAILQYDKALAVDPDHEAASEAMARLESEGLQVREHDDTSNGADP